MPSRLLREGILDSDAVNELSFPAEVFYRRLMSVVDDFGRFDGRPSILRSRLYPLRIETVREADIPRWIAECEKAGLIVLYAVDGKQYILFRKLGSPRAKESKYPAPPDGLEHYVANTHPFTDENGCKQTKASVPGSGSGSGSGSVRPPQPPEAGGVVSGRQPRKPKTLEETDPRFLRFWESYPRKVAKPDAARAFAKIDPPEELLEEILRAVSRAVKSDAWTKDGGQFIPHPATWLNKRRWEDESPEVNGTTLPKLKYGYIDLGGAEPMPLVKPKESPK
jgi:hypothetical protein